MIKKQVQYTADNFLKQVGLRQPEQSIDPKRVKRIQLSTQNFSEKEPKDELEPKAPVKFHKFREDARKNHRELTQQNHDFMKMTQTITRSVLDNQRYKLLVDDKNSKAKITSMMDKTNREANDIANLTLPFNIEINSSVIESKIEVKKVYEIYPYKKLSIELEPNNCLNPAFEFFFFRRSSDKTAELQSNLIQIVDENLLSDIKQQIASLTYYLDYFDYVHFIRYLVLKNNPKEDYQNYIKFPKFILEMAKNTHKMEASDDEEDFNKDEIIIDAANSFHRIFECDQTELSKPFDSIYFPDLADYENYKQLREIEYKNLKIEAEDVIINTDVRNIISSEKIYLINIIQEIRLSIELLKTNKEAYLMKSLHETMMRKIYEYLHLVCGYTQSTIMIKYNIAEPYKKIYEFLYKSIIYGKEYEQLDRRIFEKYPVLQIWYNIPDKIYGYAREEIHQTLYRLIEATIDFEKQIKYNQLYEGLKNKQTDRRYLNNSA